MRSTASIVVHVAITGLSFVDKRIHMLHVVDGRGNPSLPQLTVRLDTENEMYGDADIERLINEHIATYFHTSTATLSCSRIFMKRLSDDSLLINIPYTSPNNLRLLGGSKSSAEWLDRMNERCIAVHGAHKEPQGPVCLEYLLWSHGALIACVGISFFAHVFVNSAHSWHILWNMLPLCASGVDALRVCLFSNNNQTADSASRAVIKCHDIHRLVWVPLAEDSPDIDEPGVPATSHILSSRVLSAAEKERSVERGEKYDNEPCSLFVGKQCHWSSFYPWLKTPFRSFLALLQNLNAVHAVPART